MVKKVMVVDDEEGITYTVKRGIESLDKDYEIIPVSSGQECLDRLKNDQIPDLILLDIMMPEMSGWETFNQIKANDSWKNIPIVFLTARTDHVARDAGDFLGDDYIEKPVDVQNLKERIDKILKK